MNKAAEQDVDFDATETQDVEEAVREEETSSEVEVEIISVVKLLFEDLSFILFTNNSADLSPIFTAC